MSTPTSHKVLIVDDVTKNIQLVASFLKQSGYEINYALSGKAALKHVRKANFDLILLDVMMPEMDGFEVCQRLKENPDSKEIPIIFLTAKTDIDSITKAFKVGGVDYITKPFNKAELLARVKMHLESQLQKKHLKELNATKDKFFSIIAHDLRAPLNQMLALSELIQKEVEADKWAEVIRLSGHINDSAKSGSLLLENLLEWSRSQTGSIKFNPEVLDLSLITEEIMTLNEHNAAQKEITIKSKIGDDAVAYADRNMIKTVLRNLVSNSVKFTFRRGKIVLDVKKTNGTITYSVKDTGIGLQKEDIKKLFRMDVNPKTIGNHQEKGTGLGLILCKEFVEANGGEIWVESEYGKGSAFKFSLPLNPPTDQT